MSSNHHAQRGFTLVEMAFVVLIMGLVVGAMFAFLDVHQEQKRQQTTRERQQKIATALTSYAQSFGFLPCPGRPDAAILGTANTVCNTTATQSGIVPYRDLALTQQDVTDGFGNPISYSVAREAITPAVNVHANCRLNMIWIDGGTNINPRKARLCCPQVPVANQIKVYIATPYSAANEATPTQTAIPAARFANPNTVAAATTDNLAYVAYVLVSHGKNGERSFIWDQPARKVASQSGESENQNIDNAATRIFVDRPRHTAAGTAYFDDILLWRTQEALMRELNNDSCAVP